MLQRKNGAGRRIEKAGLGNRQTCLGKEKATAVGKRRNPIQIFHLEIVCEGCPNKVPQIG
jgi:hypothetical protein